RVDDKRYAFRDLQQPVDYLEHFKPGKIRCGWLKKKDDTEFVIKDCGIPKRIGHDKIDEKFGTNFQIFFSDIGDFNRRGISNKELAYQKSAKFKYDKAKEKYLNTYSFNIDNPNHFEKELLNFDDNGSIRGKVVFTGQPGKRFKANNGRWTGHFYEFIFPENSTNKELTIDKKVIDNFLFAYYEQDKNQWSVDWDYWRTKLNNGEEIPVFFSEENGKVKHFGLSYLYKLPYNYSVHDSILKTQGNNSANELDFTSCLFGYSRKIDDKLNNLKGRVHVGHAFALENTAILLDEEKYVLGTPKASYYPNYIVQNPDSSGKITGNYLTFMHDKAEISGYKRYPVRSKIAGTNFQDNMDRVATRFKPLDKGATFKCAISYHNLRAEELGALISALTFHNTTDQFHSLGMGKPFGFGRITVDVSNLNSYLTPLKAFEAYMKYSIDGWETTNQIKELLVTSTLHDNQQEIDKVLKYQTLTEFVNAKRRNNMWALLPYSKIVKQTNFKFESWSSEKERNEYNAIWNKEKEVYKELTADNLQQKYNAKLSKKRNEITQVFETEKKKLSEKLSAKLKELENIQKANAAAAEEQERIAKREEARLVAETEGPALGNIPDTDRNALDSISSAIEVWARNFYIIKKTEKIIKENPNGYLIEIFRATLKNKLVEVANLGHKTQKDKLAAPFANNPFFRKIQTWVGPDVAQQWYDDLNKTK
ncbi:MAG: TIGR03986 family CRISPR-associated RAMP protein, partial [Saprospiraceae bacterium]|nr:TIGR03986 family CRISPR-associated RAMP protein [Saprospiraceae bacterium]